MQIYLDRFCISEQMGCFGKLSIVSDVNTVFECYTIERPWLDNKPFMSCIPVGAYDLEKHSSEKYGETFAIVGGSIAHYPAEMETDETKTRYACLFHAANIYTNVSGCVGLGSNLGFLKGLWSVSNSRKTVDKFLEILHSTDEKHTLVISERPG